MRKKKLIKLSNDIIVSIKYSVLKELINELENEKLDLETKKNYFLSKDKKVLKNNEIIDELLKEINNLENNIQKNNYQLITNNELNAVLNSLSKYKNIDLLKYDLIVRSLMDNYNLTMTNKLFIESISLMFFNNKKEIADIISNFNKISNDIYGNHFKSLLDMSIKKLTNMPLNSFVNQVVSIPRKPLLVSGALVSIGVIGLSYFKVRKEAKKMTVLSPGELADSLILTATNLYYACKTFEEDLEYNLYFKNKLREINLKRKYIIKETFEDFKEFESNSMKVKLLHNFDNYLIENIKLRKKRSK